MSTTIDAGAQHDLEANKTLVRSFVDAWNARDFNRFEDLMAESAVLHIGGEHVP
jgi:hypothetical protein